jgi:hypothetical protein
MIPRFFIQKMKVNEPEKKVPSTAANAIRRSPKVDCSSEIHWRAHSALGLIQGMIPIASKRKSRSAGSFDVCDEKRVGLGVDVLPYNLEEVHLLGDPERRFGLLVHLPNLT